MIPENITTETISMIPVNMMQPVSTVLAISKMFHKPIDYLSR